MQPIDWDKFGKKMQEWDAKREGNMCYILDWFLEDLPLEDKSGTTFVQEVQNELYRQQKKQDFFEYFGKKKQEAPPPVQMIAYPTQKMKVLVFPDKEGWIEGILANAPEGRIASITRVKKDAGDISEKEMNDMISEKWDMVIFGMGLIMPRSDDVDAVIEMFDDVTTTFFYLNKAMAKNEGAVTNLAIITRCVFSNEPELHDHFGIAAITHSNLYGHGQTCRQETGANVQYIDTEPFLYGAPWGPSGDYKILERIATEIFRNETFGKNDVRILYSGRYVQRYEIAKPYQKAGCEFRVPNKGVIGIAGGNGGVGLVFGNWILDRALQTKTTGFEIQFLSRSMKISDQNMPLWVSIQEKAGWLGVKVEQAKMDMSSSKGMEDWVLANTPNITGFIHSAGVIRDSLLVNLTMEKNEDVFLSKHKAALFIHEAFEIHPNPLEFFVNFSSVAVYGSMGQWNYSGANAFLDGLTRHRVAVGLPSTCAQWGAWGEVGMAATMNEVNKRRVNLGPMPYFTNEEGIRGWEQGLQSGVPYFSVFKYGPSAFGMVTGRESPSELYQKAHLSQIFPVPPTDTITDQKLYYDLYMHAREEDKSYDLSKGLVFSRFVQPKMDRRGAKPIFWIY